MKYQILIVEDESVSRKFLQNIILHRTQQYEIKQALKNGKETLEYLSNPENHPIDLIFTDIRMPLVNGLELIAQVAILYPDIKCVLCSGYADFEYAQQGIKFGVIDYLIKPINPKQVEEILHKERHKLAHKYYFEQCKNFACHWKKNASVLSNQDSTPYWISILRIGNLSSSFSRQVIDLDLSAALMTFLLPYQDIWAMEYSDKLECILIASAHTMDFPQFKDTLLQVSSKYNNFTTTLVWFPHTITLPQLNTHALKLHQTLKENLVIGLSQNINYCSPISTPCPSLEQQNLLDSMQSKLIFFTENQKYQSIKAEMIKLFAYWEEIKLPQLYLENNLKNLLDKTNPYLPNTGVLDFLSAHKSIDELTSYCNSFGEILAGFTELYLKRFQALPLHSSQKQSKYFLDAIDCYLKSHLDLPLHFQSICSIFGISSSYLSRLFKKHYALSFNEYVTHLKIEKAKQIFQEHPQIFVKDVAKRVGFNDPFYFSKVFRSLTGLSPKEYLHQNSTKILP